MPTFQIIPEEVLALHDPALVYAFLYARKFSNWDTGRVTSPVETISCAAAVSPRTLRHNFGKLVLAGFMRKDGDRHTTQWWVIPPNATAAKLIGPARQPVADGDRETPRPDALAPASSPYDQITDPGGVDRSIGSDRSPSEDPSADRIARAKAKRADVDAVLAAWSKASGEPSVADLATRTVVLGAVNMAGVERCVRAVQGIWGDEWHVARGPTLRKCLGTADTITQFSGMVPKARVGLSWGEFQAKWEELYVEAIHAINASPKIPAVAGDVVRGLAVTHRKHFSGANVPQFGVPMLDIHAVNLGAAAIARQRITALDPSEDTAGAARTCVAQRVDTYRHETDVEVRRRAASVPVMEAT